ncbi:glycosyltransferase family 25 protein [Proteus myxofaciens]|uniref:Beta-1,4-galactosyltransferase n=1 Tax=Proteus myxofaciens ATCC 19692 TaxID=1354337 RepID=A0A198FE01_9GAMM|nr:glycosyltransferase family 25 protein [Proteus myxofaciens]OAT22629.1 beta-1,4-galactosyltransferase [Proteus myxofaciens ATCC 19692]
MLTTFIINLKENKDRRNIMIEQLKNTALNYQFIEAIRGTDLTEQQIKSKVQDYPDCLLTKGEIGCALSHIKIYQKMVDEDIEYALVLEDDAVVPKNLEKTINEIIQQDIKHNRNVYLLSEVISYIQNKKLHSNIYSAYHACGAHGYLINLKAAKKLLSVLNPIRYEADMWWIFRFRKYINVYCIIPHLINTNDEDKSSSSLEKERAKTLEQREKYRNKVHKNERFYHFYRILEKINNKYTYKIVKYNPK